MNGTAVPLGATVEMKSADHGTGDIANPKDKRMQMRIAENNFLR